MTGRDLRRRLERLDLPEEHEARTRTWHVVRAAFASREPVTHRRFALRPLAVLAAVLALLAAALTPSGRAVLDSVRDAVVPERVVRARPALLSLPAHGRVLVVAHGGAWIVHEDGARRRLGAYSSAAWSPRGLFVVATRARELVALDPKGNVRWALAKPLPVAWPRWAPSGYRIAYKAGTSLRVVAGDGSGDRLLARSVAFAAPALAWKPDVRSHVLAFADRDGRVRVVDADTRRQRWVSAPADEVVELAWSADGMRLVAVGSRRLRIFGGNGAPLATLPLPAGAKALAFAPRSHRFALALPSRPPAGESELVLLDAERQAGRARRLFSGTGIFQDVAWSPDGRWILLTWPSADQWVFVRAVGRRRLDAVSSITRQFGAPDAAFPVVAGWCCPSSP